MTPTPTPLDQLQGAITTLETAITQLATDNNNLNGLKQADQAAQDKVKAAQDAQAITAKAVSDGTAAVATDNTLIVTAANSLSNAALAVAAAFNATNQSPTPTPGV